VKVYSLISTEGADCDPRPGGLRLCHSFTLPEYKGTVSDINVCGHIVVAAIARFSDMTYPPSYEVLLINVLTGAELLFDPKLPQVGVDVMSVVQSSVYLASADI
jgi:hypothetical protein